MHLQMEILGSENNANLNILNNHAEALSSDGVAFGGAIRVKNSTNIRDFAQISITGNYAEDPKLENACGGGISNVSTLILENNDKVLIRGNYVTDGSTYRLSGIEGSGDIVLNAGEGQSMEIYDGINTSSELYFNKTAEQTGTILLSGKNTVADLKAVGSKATVAEVDSSRLVSANWMYQYGGLLQVKDGMKLKVANAFYHRGGEVEFENAAMYAGTIDMGSVAVKGANTWKFSRSYGTDELTFNLSVLNKKTPVLTLESSSVYTINGSYQGKYIISSDETLRTGIYRLLSFDSTKIRWSNLSYIELDGLCSATTIGTAGTSDVYFLTEGDITTLVFDYVKPRYLTWVSTSGTWSEGTGLSSGTWSSAEPDTNFYEGDHVIFNKAATVSIQGKVKPASIKVSNTSGNVVLGAASGGDSITGSAKLTKTGAGTLTIRNTNSFTGGAEITGGKVVLNAENALGTGAISVSNAELSATSRINALGLTLKNSKMTQTGGGTGLTLRSSMSMENSDLLLKAPLNGTFLTMTKGSSINMLDSCTRNITLSGTLNATDSDITMYGHTQTNNLTLKNSDYTSVGGAARDLKVTNTLSMSSGAKLRHHGAIHAKNVTVNGSNITQTGGGKGLNLSGALTMSNKATVSLKGPLTAASVTLSGSSVLDSVDQYSRQVTLNGSMSATDSSVKLYGNVVMNALTLRNATFDMDGKYTRSLTLKSGSAFTNSTADLYGFLTGTNLTLNNSTLNQRGGNAGLQLSGSLTMNNSAVLNLKSPLKAASVSLSSGAKLNMQDSVTRAITLTGSMSATKATVNHYGKLKAANLTLTDSTYSCKGRYATGMDISGTTKLSNSKLDIYGYLNSKNLTLNKGRIQQSGTGNVTISGTLTMNSGSTLTTSGTLSAGAMTLNGGTINLTAGALKTIKVSNTLTLNSAIDLNLGCSLKQGVNYTLISFNKTNLTKSSNLSNLLGMNGSGASLTLGSKSITLKVTNSSAWNKYVAANKNLFNSTTTAMLPESEEEEETVEAIMTSSLSETTEAVAAFDRSEADMLVQSNWGIVNASRAFTDTIGNRASNSTAFGADKDSSVWMSAMGAASRLSSDGEAAGSDYSLYGAAIGMEQQLTEKSSLGLAIGESRGRVNSFTSARTKQDTLHTALYGQHLLQQSTNDALTLGWSAAYGSTESKWQGIEWEQKSVQLDARATWAHRVSEITTVSGFAGMQYFASESAQVEGAAESGSIQNLRGEIGVGIGHRATSRTAVYGELSFVGDMVRHNPTADTGATGVSGSNPGRTGLNLSAGVNHALNDKWSVNANYNLELQERANSHSANIGASYRF